LLQENLSPLHQKAGPEHIPELIRMAIDPELRDPEAAEESEEDDPITGHYFMQYMLLDNYMLMLRLSHLSTYWLS
jgi:hypothetical protein